jgi:hypothetical protein
MAAVSLSSSGCQLISRLAFPVRIRSGTTGEFQKSMVAEALE